MTDARALIKSMLENQAALNSKAYSTEWIEKAKTGEWNYLIAATQEIAEFINSYWTPWWSKAEQDLANCRIEIVDALHFMLSAAIVMAEENLDEAADFVTESYEWAKLGFIEAAQDGRGEIETLAVAQVLQVDLNAGQDSIFESLFTLGETIGFGLDKMYALYMGKSVLNQFRQDNGYKVGTYKKKWDGVHEDNHFLSVWIDEQTDTPTVEQIRNFLETEYAKYK